jgi:hypothetical protein
MHGTRRESSTMRGAQVDTPLMRSLWRFGRVHIFLGSICWIDAGIAGLSLPTKPCLLYGIVMVAEMLELICLAHQRPGLVSPSFVSGGLRQLDCLMYLVLMGIV